MSFPSLKKDKNPNSACLRLRCAYNVQYIPAKKSLIRTFHILVLQQRANTLKDANEIQY